MKRVVAPAVARAAALTVAVVLILLSSASPAAADPAGPTDYRSEVESVEPPAPDILIEMIGGDSFIRMSVPPGVSVEVVGYRGEPYLRFGADGIVLVNDSSPSTYLNEDRYGDTEVPDFATPEADPVWRIVADDGDYSWHDHRTHWMNESRPAGGPGDRILEAVIPIVVDGVETDVAVASTWMAGPSPVAAVAGAAIGLLVALLAARAGPRKGGGVYLLLGLGAAAVSVVAYRSVPPETAPSLAPTAAPLMATATAVYGMWRRVPDAVISILAPALVLLVWGVFRRQWLTRAILPTAIPTADRFVTAMVLAAAAGALVTVVIRERRLAPRR